MPEGNLAEPKTLGLRIVHILAKRLEARLTVESGRGTTFALTFPREAEAPREPGGLH
jgi:two-component sensor histidine kinase